MHQVLYVDHKILPHPQFEKKSLVTISIKPFFSADSSTAPVAFWFDCRCSWRSRQHLLHSETMVATVLHGIMAVWWTIVFFNSFSFFCWPVAHITEAVPFCFVRLLFKKYTLQSQNHSCSNVNCCCYVPYLCRVRLVLCSRCWTVVVAGTAKMKLFYERQDA